MIRVFCDFDGTVCTADVGEQLFRNFVRLNTEQFVEQFIRGELSGRELLQCECSLLPRMDREVVEEFALQFHLDPYFREFEAFCRQHGITITILSDGLDVYITTILKREGLHHIPVYANCMHFVSTPNGTEIRVEFRYSDEECSECGNCKRNHLLVQSSDEDIIIYIGDGYSDRCPVEYADYIFAKRHLIPYCQQKNITYYEFKNFDDVRRKLEELLQRKRLRHRVEAMRARSRVFMQG
ncbi:MAG: MtnX-like HAD-IB family phosphatase [Bacteroidetes bacterium]|nr:MtnX-like HAD-IB family phosphatase [Bacteroidota bacterium]